MGTSKGTGMGPTDSGGTGRSGKQSLGLQESLKQWLPVIRTMHIPTVSATMGPRLITVPHLRYAAAPLGSKSITFTTRVGNLSRIPIFWV
ncbi:MAG: hypothetical protein ACP5M0_04480 [Desulfomonilaceae bacterium]